MSLSSESDRSTIGQHGGRPGDGVSPGDAAPGGPTPGGPVEIDALPVLAGQPTLVRPYSSPGALSRTLSDGAIPVAQAAAAAAGGFLAGAFVVGLANRRGRRSVALAKGRGAGRRLGRRGRAGGSVPGPGELIQIVGSRSLLVDVHLLGSR